MSNKEENDSFIDYEEVKKAEEQLRDFFVVLRVKRRGRDRLLPPISVLLIMCAIAFLLYSSQINRATTFIENIPFIVTFICMGYTGFRFRLKNSTFKVNCLSVVITFFALFTSLLFDIKISVPLTVDVIAILIILYLEIDIHLKTLKNICLEIIEIDSIDYEIERIVLEEKNLNKKFIMKYDLGEKLKVGDKFKIDILHYYDYESIYFDYNGKEVKGYHFININKDNIFNKTY